MGLWLVQANGLRGVNTGRVRLWAETPPPDEEEPPPPPPGSIATTMQSSVTQNNITITFNGTHPVGQYVSGDYFVVGSPTITSISPAWDGAKHGAVVDPGVDSLAYHTALSYTAANNFAASLPRVLTAGRSLVATWGWGLGDEEVAARSVTTTENPAAPRPCVRDSLVLTAESVAPPIGSFRPPYVAGTKWRYRESDLRTNRLANLTPSSNAPSWETVESWLSKTWAPDSGYGSRNSRYFHPANHMPDYGRDLCGQMYAAILRLNTAATLAEKRTTLLKVVQYGIDTLAITRLAAQVQFRTSGAQTYPGWWGDFGGAHGVGRDLPALLTKHLLGNPAELQAVWDLGPRWWGDMGQIWVSNGDAAQDPWRSAGLATWGEAPHTRPNSRRPGTTSYRSIAGRAVACGILAAHAMGIAGQWNHPDAPLIDYMDWYINVDRAGDPAARFLQSWCASMWDTHRSSF